MAIINFEEKKAKAIDIPNRTISERGRAFDRAREAYEEAESTIKQETIKSINGHEPDTYRIARAIEKQDRAESQFHWQRVKRYKGETNIPDLDDDYLAPPKLLVEKGIL